MALPFRIERQLASLPTGICKRRHWLSIGNKGTQAAKGSIIHVPIIYIRVKNGIKRGVERVTKASKARSLSEDEPERNYIAYQQKTYMTSVVEHLKTSIAKSVSNS